MNATEIIRIIEKGSEQYFSGLVEEVRSNLGTSHYRRLSNDELARRITAVYLNLEHWIATRDEAVVQSTGVDLGKRRFEEGIPLGQVVLALVLEENYLRKYLSNQGVPPEGEWGQTITEFFQKTMYSTAHGYEVALAHSNRLAQRAAVPAKPPAAAPPKPVSRTEDAKAEGDVQISRGGQIGEFAG